MKYKQLYPTTDYSNINQLIKNSELNLAELKRIDAQQPKGSILFRYFYEPYADGRIHWQVVKVSNRTCTVMACEGINLDEWAKGTQAIKLGYAEEMIKRRVAMETLFGSK